IVSEELLIDEIITAEDLDIDEPNLLPNNPFYVFKEIGRGLQSFFTFNQIKKLELKEKFSNEKILEVKKMVEQGVDKKGIEIALRNYEKELGDMQRISTRIQEKNETEDDEEVGKFLDKFIQKQILHQRIIQKLENQISEETMTRIRETKEKQLENFSQVMTKLEDNNAEKIQKRLEKNIKEIKGSDFQGLKNLEFLGELIEKVPEEVKNAVRNARESTLDILKEKLESLSDQEKEKLQKYIENISGDGEKQLEILNRLKEELPIIEKLLIDSGEKIQERIRERVQENNGEFKEEIKEDAEDKNDDMNKIEENSLQKQIMQPIKEMLNH
ncbi:MAG: DUF5667 domain-containing protein, partial [Candidatus Nealsonbacteria bacterium]